MINKNRYEVLKDQCAQLKAKIGNELDEVDSNARILDKKFFELRNKMMTTLSFEVSLEQDEFQRLFEFEGTIGLMCEPGMEPIAMPVEVLGINYPEKEFDGIIFADEDLVVMFDEEDVVDEDGVRYLCGPMFIVHMDEYGNIESVNDESIRDILYYLDLKAVKMNFPDEEDFRYTVFHLE